MDPQHVTYIHSIFQGNCLLYFVIVYSKCFFLLVTDEAGLKENSRRKRQTGEQTDRVPCMLLIVDDHHPVCILIKCDTLFLYPYHQHLRGGLLPTRSTR